MTTPNKVLLTISPGPPAGDAWGPEGPSPASELLQGGGSPRAEGRLSRRTSVVENSLRRASVSFSTDGEIAVVAHTPVTLVKHKIPTSD
eukprot:2812191-Pyramimonas_sp.AAC.1